MSSKGLNFETDIMLHPCGDGDHIKFYHPKKKLCSVVTAKMTRIRKGLWTAGRFPRKTDRHCGNHWGVQFCSASTPLAAARKFYKQFETGWFR